MSDIFERFVSESTALHKSALIEQSRISEDINKQSMWFLGITTAALGLLIARYQSFAKDSWLQPECLGINIILIIIGGILLASTFVGAWHQHLSIEERNCYRVLITLFGAQGLIPFYKHPDYPTDTVPEDMHVRISEGELLNHDKLNTFKKYKASGVRYRSRAERAFSAQKILAAIGYLTLFVVAVPNA